MAEATSNPAGTAAGPRPAPAEPDLAAPELYVNRELSLLEFQRRVLDQARDPANPLLDRVRFLAIVGSNLEEFFMVRVAGLKQQADAGVVDVTPDGLTPAEQLAAIRRETLRLLAECEQCLEERLLPELRERGIRVLAFDELDDEQRFATRRYFEQNVYPVLTPMAVDQGRPFPHISNLSSNLAIVIADDAGTRRFARLKIPAALPLFIPVDRPPGSDPPPEGAPRPYDFVRLDELIRGHIQALFPGMRILAAHPFRIVRDADVAIQELEADDLLETVEDTVRQRQFGRVVLLAVNSDMPQEIKDLLLRHLKISPAEVYEVPALVWLSRMAELASIDRHDLRWKPFLPAVPRVKRDKEQGSIFAAIRREDVLLHHPYESFSPVVEFLRRAARDEGVLAIKLTLYRVGRNSPVVEALLEARENRKEVAVLVELKARFDEESNIGWARALEKAGVHVIYGLLGLKTHAKLALVVRKEGDAIRRYVHLSTGNYNAVTAQLYTDVALLTSDPDIGADASDLFNYITGYSARQRYRKLLVAPVSLRQRMEALIEREIEHARAGREARIVFKMNSLVDRRLIELLYRASRAGVRVELLVRGICCLRPGIPGVSDRIRVVSIVGRFLEHARIYYFRNGGADELYLGSADLMPRNLDHRVEVLFPVEDPRLVDYLRSSVLEVQLLDNVKAREMRPDARYVPLPVEAGGAPLDSQALFLGRARPEPG